MQNYSYGICSLSVVPVRTEPSDKAELGSQLLFGDVFTITGRSEDGKWVSIVQLQDEYKGWIDVKQYEEVGPEYYSEYKKLTWPVVNDMIGLVQGAGKVFPILMGSSLPFFYEEKVIIGKNILKYTGEVSLVAPNPDFGLIERNSRLFIGAPYLWGGKTHFGIDCSGFVQQVLKMSGYKIPRDAYLQAEAGIKVDKNEARPGDLAFFHNAHGKIFHVGILLSNQHIIHASGEVRIDIFDETGIFNPQKQSYTHKLASIVRILGV
ncbi:MAG: NlpC/P60 family protein [Cytophagaceae bacterium]